MDFPFHLLSTDLVLEIISYAASPDVDCLTSIYGRRGTYSSALALSAVSYDFRLAAMPHLLRTVILRTSHDVQLFVRALLRQRYFRYDFPHLALDYKYYVRRFWCTESLDEDDDMLYNHIALEGYDLLYDLISNTQSIGLGFNSLHLLHSALLLKSSLSGSLLPYWQSCRRVTFAGPFFRWNILATTMEGIQFLGQISHLTLWITEFTAPLPTHQRIPSWVTSIPFHLLHRLTRLSILLIPNFNEEELGQMGHYGEYFSPHPLEMLVLSCPSRRGQDEGDCNSEEAGFCKSAGMIESWLHSSDPLAHGIVYPLHGVPRTAAGSEVASSWEAFFLEGRDACPGVVEEPVKDI